MAGQSLTVDYSLTLFPHADMSCQFVLVVCYGSIISSFPPVNNGLRADLVLSEEAKPMINTGRIYEYKHGQLTKGGRGYIAS